MQVEQYYSDDYAGLDAGNLKFYYGYEVVDEEDKDMWCFQVKKDGKEIHRITKNQIDKFVANTDQLDDVRDYLIAGIGMYMALK